MRSCKNDLVVMRAYLRARDTTSVASTAAVNAWWVSVLISSTVCRRVSAVRGQGAAQSEDRPTTSSSSRTHTQHSIRPFVTQCTDDAYQINHPTRVSASRKSHTHAHTHTRTVPGLLTSTNVLILRRNHARHAETCAWASCDSTLLLSRSLYPWLVSRTGGGNAAQRSRSTITR